MQEINSSNFLPELAYKHIFRKLEAKDLASASLVCRHWHQQASDNQLWEALCLQESISPYGAEVMDFCNYHRLYGQSISLNTKIRTITPQVDRKQINPPRNQEQSIHIETFLATPDYEFLYLTINMMSKFEIWDISLEKRLFSMRIDRKMFSPRIEQVGNSIYFSGRTTAIKPINTIYVYVFDLQDNQALRFRTIWEFQEGESWHFRKAKFELGTNLAMFGRVDGGIDCIDLKSEGIRYIENHSGYPSIWYQELSDWNQEDEWIASYSKTEVKHVANIIENGKFEPLFMEEGVYERRLMQKRRDNYLATQKRKQLIGHEGAVTALRMFGDSLFSSAKDGTIKQWNLLNYTCSRTIDTGLQEGCCFLQVTSHYIFGLEEHREKNICQWDIISNQCLYSIDLEKTCSSFQVVGNVLFCNLEQCMTYSIEIYDIGAKEFIKTFECEGYRVENPQFLNDRLHFTDGHQMITWNFSATH